MIAPSNGELLGVLVFADPEAPPAHHFAGLPGFSASVVPDGAPWADRLSDWQIMTPLGSITPNSLHVVRALRADRPRIEQVLAEHRARRRG